MSILKVLSFGLIGAILYLNVAIAHEMVPTYPKWRVSSYENVLVTTIEMFNKREDVDYYEIGVFDKNFNPVPFVSSYKIMKLDYLKHVIFDVYIGKEDAYHAYYICSKSKLRKEDTTRTAVSSKICSRFKWDKLWG